MNKRRKIPVGVIMLFSAFVLLFIVSHVYYGRSVMATVSEYVLKAVGAKNTLLTVAAAEEHMKDLSEEHETPYVLPKLIQYRGNAVMQEYEGMQVIVFNEDSDSEDMLLYMHGGAYVDRITIAHLIMLEKLADQIDMQITVPLYPLAPEHTYEETYRLMTAYYQDLRKEFTGRIVFMGDSAGGGFVIAFAEYLGETGLTQPDRIVALSPWLDTTMSNPLAAEYEDEDPTLAIEGLVAMGNAWAGDTDARDYRISPMFGSTEHLNEIYFFVGNRELFYPDVTSFYERLKDEGKTTDIVIGQGLNHVFPCYPIPEAGDAISQIAKFILAEYRSGGV